MPQSPSVLVSLSPRMRERLLDHAVPRCLGPDQVLALTGDEVRLVYIVRAGIFKLCTRDQQGRQTTLGLAAPGDLLGITGVLSDARHHLDAIALTDAALLAIPRDRFLHALIHEPGAALTLARCLAIEARSMTETILERTTSTGSQRLAGSLLALGNRFGSPSNDTVRIDLPLSQTEIGEIAGLCRESVCKTMRRFKSLGAADYDYARRLILRPHILDAIRSGE